MSRLRFETLEEWALYFRTLANHLERRPCAPSLDGYDLVDGLRAAAEILSDHAGPPVHVDEAANDLKSPRVPLRELCTATAKDEKA